MLLSQRNLAKAEKLISEWEGLRLEAYLDSVGKWTIGFGQTRGVKRGMKWTSEQAWADLRAGMREYAEKIAPNLRPDTTDDEFCALLAFAWNVGWPNANTSTLFRRHNASAQYPDIKAAFLMWVKGTVNGRKVTIPGLVNRRTAEYTLYSTGKVVGP